MIDCGGQKPHYLNQLTQWAKEHDVPLVTTLELTPFCNFSCVMCYVRMTPEQAVKQGSLLTVDQWLDIAHQAREMGTLYLTITGGEPLMYPDFWKLYEKLNQMGFLITILSNGTLIDEAVMEKFQQFGLPHAVKLTLYGASNETYLRTCCCPDGFSRISRAIELLHKAGVPVSMTATIVRENSADLHQMHRFARQHGIVLQHTTTVVQSSRGVQNSALTSRYSFDEFVDELTLEVLEKNKLPPLGSPFAWCASYRSSLFITWNGKLQLCSFLSDPSVSWSGNLHENWSKLIMLGHALKSPAECSDCQWSMFCQRCPGLLCSESGHPEKISPNLCQTAENLYKLYHKRLSQEE